MWDTETKNSKIIRLYDQIEDLDVSEKNLINSDGRGFGNGALQHWNSEVDASVDANTLKQLFFTEDWVYIVVDLAASEMSSVPMQVVRKDGDGNEEVLLNHDVTKLLERPNKWEDQHAFSYRMGVEWFLEGNVIAFDGGEDGGLVVIPTETVRPVFEGPKLLAYEIVLRDEFGNQTDTLNLDPEQIIHLKKTNPATMLWGLSPFVAGSKAVMFNRYTSDYLNAFYQKGATPGFAIKLDKTISEQAALRMLRSFEMAYTGRRNQRRTLVLPKGTDLEKVSNTIAEQELTELVNMNMDKIINLIGVPKHALSLQKVGSLGSEEHKMALRHFWTARLIPTLKQFAGQFTNYFRDRGDLSENEHIRYDLSRVEALKDDASTKAKIAQQMLSTRTLNEVRSEVWNEQPLQGGDRIIGQVAIADPSPGNEQTLPERSMLGEKIANWIVKQEGDLDREVERREKRVVNRHLDLFSDFAEATIEMLEKEQRKAEDDPVPIISIREFRRRLRRFLNQFEDGYVEDHVRDLFTTVELGYDNQLELVFNERDRAAIEALKESGESGRRLILESRGIDSFKSIADTSTNKIMDIIQEGVERSAPLKEIAREIALKTVDPEATISRARTIARTEVLTATSIGAKAEMDDAKRVIPDLVKVWLSARDTRVRDTHQILDGQVRGANEKFDSPGGAKLDYPRDLDAPPEEAINCRCTMLTVSRRDLEELNL